MINFTQITACRRVMTQSSWSITFCVTASLRHMDERKSCRHSLPGHPFHLFSLLSAIGGGRYLINSLSPFQWMARSATVQTCPKAALNYNDGDGENPRSRPFGGVKGNSLSGAEFNLLFDNSYDDACSPCN